MPVAPAGGGAGGPSRGRGHAVREHTADVVIEAWGPTRAACLEEALAALAETYSEPDADVDAGAAPAPHRLRWHHDGVDGEDLLADLLDDAIARLDCDGLVTVAGHLTDGPDGSVTGELLVVPLEAREVTGASPKGVSRSDLRLGPDDGGWSARAIIDV